MNKLLVGFLILLVTPLVNAKDATFVNGDGSPHTSVCIAAIDSEESLKAAIKKYNFSSLELARLNCNGLSVDKFAKMYRDKSDEMGARPVKVFSFGKEMNNIESDICIAAASSNAKFESIKQGLTKPKSYYRSINCNGMALGEFAKKYGNKKFKL